ncbi:MAG: choice-of-anchor J domain-containing protein [Bacteroidales bacterium]|nr:choice-of-anchor J domain-containing protein [Bacteroidales bacterium]
MPITTLPWNEGFEGITSANELPPCMSKTSSGVETYLASTTYNRSARTGSKFAAFKWDADDYLFTPGFQLVAGATYNFSFYYKADGKDGFGPLAARLCSGQTSADTVSTIGIQVDTFTNTTYQEYNGTFTVGSDDVYYIGIYCEGDGEPWYASIDDLSLTLVSMPCIAPTNVTSSEITQTSAKISWTSSASASSWQVKLGDNGSVIDTNVTNYTFNNLTAGTNYIAYVRSKCSDTTYSDWASVFIHNS